MKNEKEFYTVKEFAALLSVHFRQVLALIHAGRIKAINVSLGSKPSYRILCKEYLRFVADEYTKQNTGDT